MATDTQIVEIKTWLQKHERMIVCALVLATTLYLGNKYIDISAAKAQARSDVASQLASEAKVSAQQAALQSAQTQAQYQAMVVVLSQQNAVLAQAITQRDAILGKQQTAVQTAPLTDVAVQWQTAIGGSGDITASASGLNVSDSGARRTLIQILELPVLRADLADQKEVTKNTQTQLEGANKALAADAYEVEALKTLVGTNDAKCAADLKSVKAEGRKNSVKWFKRGFIVGFVAGLWGGHAAGL